MPGTIPYNHPSLVLGHVADTGVMLKLQQMARLQNATDAAQDKLNALVQMKRSMTLTMSELSGMGVDMGEMENKLKEVDAGIASAANEYMTVYLQNESALAKLKSELANDAQGRNETPESPIDFGASKLESRPLSTESLKLDSQYFSVEGCLQTDTLANIENFVRDATGDGDGQVAKTVSAQVANQNRNHRLCGTLIIVARCTHRNVGVFSPLVIDPDKAVRAWNRTHDRSKRIESPAWEMPGRDDGEEEEGLTLITGAVYASSFVGMVHILQAETEQTDDFDKLKDRLEQKLRVGGWLSNVSGGVGIDPAVLEEVKGFLSSQSVSTHISVVTMGVAPPIKSHTLRMGVRELAEVDEDKLQRVLSPFQLGESTTASDSEEACRKYCILCVQNMRTQSLVSAMADMDRKDNNVLDINSLMTALDNYIEYVNGQEELKGAPVHFYTRTLTRSEILRLWHEKYRPKAEGDEGGTGND